MPKQPDVVNLILNTVQKEMDQEHTKPRSIGVYRGSEVGGCERAIAYSALQYPAEPMSPELVVLLKDGHFHQRMVTELMQKTGIVSNIELGISKKYKHKGQSFLLTGTTDLVWNGIVVDVKGISTFRFRYLDKNFPGEFMSYVAQIRVYMDILNLPLGMILFKNKNDSELRPKYVVRDEAEFTKILDKIADLHALVKKKELPARPYGKDTWHCKYCQYRHVCWKEPAIPRRWQGVTNATSDSLAGKLRQSLKRREKARPRASTED